MGDHDTRRATAGQKGWMGVEYSGDQKMTLLASARLMGRNADA
jgi:hypothetical protein